MKNRKKANIILALLILFFMLLAVLKHYYGEPLVLRTLIFIVEAALVGSVADWFAVTALFERPLYLPIKPIIPSNREKILSNLSKIVNDNLLDMNYIQNTIENIPISKTLIHIIDDKALIHKVRNSLLSYIINELEKFKNDKAKYTRFINFLQGKTKDINFTKTKVIKIADSYIQKHFTKKLYMDLIDKAIAIMIKDAAYKKIYNMLDVKITKEAGNKFRLLGGIKNIVDTDSLAKAIQIEGINFLRELQVSNQKYNDIKKLLNKYSIEYLEKTDLEKILEDFFQSEDIEKRINIIITKAQDILAAMLEDKKDDSVQMDANLQFALNTITDLIENLWKQIKSDEETLSRVDSVIKELLIEIILKNRLEFSRFIEERIKGFTDAQLSTLIENSAGEPLHWIRINGSLLGAMLGILFFSFINFLYEPFILPLAYKFIGLF